MFLKYLLSQVSQKIFRFAIWVIITIKVVAHLHHEIEQPLCSNFAL